MSIDLFENSDSVYQLDLPDADISYYPCFIDLDQADHYLAELINDINWQQESIVVYGQQHKVPRLSAWYAEQGRSYQYSGLKKTGLPWIPVLLELRKRISQLCNASFNSVLANLYRDQNDGVGWHADDEPELGQQPVIASLSFGQNRTFQLKHNQDKNLRRSIELAHGSLLLMQGDTQHYWQHQVPKSKRSMSERVNLTFRKVNY